MKLAASVSRLLPAVMAFGLLAGCQKPVPELVPALTVPEQAVWFEAGDPWTAYTRDGLAVQGPQGVGQAASGVRVEGGLWVCTDTGLAAFSEATGTWTSYAFEVDFHAPILPSCLFDARSTTDAYLYAQSSSFGSTNPYLCRLDASGWSCQESEIPSPSDLKVTKSKLWLLSTETQTITVVDEAGTREFPTGDESYWGALGAIPGSDVVYTPFAGHIMEYDGESVEDIDVRNPYGDDGGYATVPLAPGHYYIVAGDADYDESCHIGWNDSGCDITEVHWSEVTVLELEDGETRALAKHRDAGVLWAPTAVLYEGELRVKAGQQWFELP